MSHEVLADALNLLIVAADEWNVRGTQVAYERRVVVIRDAERRARLRDVRTRAGRIHEVDAQIELLLVTPELPGSDEIVAALRATRARLVAETF